MTNWLNFNRMGLRQRLTFYTLFLMFIPVLVITGIVAMQWTDDIRDSVEAGEISHINSVRSGFELFLERSKTDILYLSNSPAVQQLATAIQEDDGRGVATSRQLVIEDFLNLISVSEYDIEGEDYPFYQQLRFLDTNGREYIRVQRVYEANSRAREVVNWQYQGNRDYFLNTVRLPNDGETFYISDVTLSRETLNAEIDTLSDGSPIPVMHLGMPVYIDGELTGVIITTVYFENFYDLLAPSEEDAGSALLNEDGYFIFNSLSPNQEFGFEPGIENVQFTMPDGAAESGIADVSIRTIDPENAEELLGSGTSIRSLNTQELLSYYTRLAPTDANFYWVFMSLRDPGVVFSGIQDVTLLVLFIVVSVFIIGILVTFYYTRRLISPLHQLTERATVMAQGDLSTSIESETIYREDEIGDLSRSFNAMAFQVRDLVGEMEDRIAARTNDLATSAEIAAAANQVRDLNELLNLTVNLIRDRFNFYYVQVYLVRGNWAELKEGTGYVGRKLIAREHRLPLDGRSLVAQTIAAGKSMVVQDTKTDPSFLPNDLLPNTKSEVVIPLRAQDHVIGALDIQHDVANAFEPETILLFQAMADQLAITFENVTLFQNTEQRALELETVAEVSIQASTNLNTSELLFSVTDLVKERFNLYHAHIYLTDDEGSRLNLVAGAGEVGRTMVENKRSISVSNKHSLVATVARNRQGLIVNDVVTEMGFLPNPLLPDTRSEMAMPLIVGNKLLGILDVQSSEVDRFTESDLKIQSILAAQIAVALENAQSFQSMQEARAETERLFNSSIDLIGTADFEGYFRQLNPAWESLGWTLDELMSRPYVEFVHPDDVENTARESNDQLAAGNKTISFINRYRTKDGNYRWLSWNSTPDTERGMIYFVTHDITEEKVAQEQIQRRVTELAAIANVSRKISSILDVNQLLTEVADVAAEAFDLYHIHIYLTDDTGESLNLIAGTGQAPCQHVGTGYSINIHEFDTPVTRAARTLEIQMDNHVAEDVNLEINPFLPQTRSQMVTPIVLAGRLLGAVEVHDAAYDRFGEDDIRIQTVLVEQIAIALENARSFQAVQEARAEAERLFNSSIDLIGTADFNGYFRQLNPAWESLGWTMEELMRRPYVEFVHPDDVENTARESNEQLAAGFKTLSFVNRYRTKGGSYRWLSWNSTPDVDHGMIYFVAHDITDEKLAQELIAKHANEMDVVAQVSAAATSTLDIDELLWNVVNLTKDRFGLYHAHIYLLDDAGDQLALSAGAGDVGQIMVAGGLSIAITREASIVARAARNREPVVVNNVTAETGFLPNPLLPDTRSELAMPLIVGNKLLGILDVQSSELDYFTHDDVQVQSTLASQIAVAIENARSFQSMQAARAESDRLFNTSIDLIGSATFEGYFRQLNPAWETTLGWTIEELMSRPFAEFIHPDDVEITNREVDEQLALGHKTLSFVNRYQTKDGNYRWLSWNSTPDVEHGVIYFVTHDVTDERYAQELIARRANEMEVVAQVSAEATSSLDTEELLWNVSNLTKDRFGFYHTHIYLLNSDATGLVLTAGAGEVGRQMVARHHTIPVTLEHSLVARAARTQKSVIVNDVTRDLNFLPNPLLPLTIAEIAIPMIVGNRVIGVLDIQADEADRFSDQDIEVLSTLASQIAVAVENARAFEQISVYADTVANTPVGTYVYRAVDPEDAGAMRVMIANPASALISGIDSQAIIGKTYREVYPSVMDTELPGIYLKIAMEGGAVDLGELSLYSDYHEEERVFEVRAFSLPNQSVGVTFEDVTERKLQEQQIHKRANEMEVVAQVSAEATRTLDINELLLSVTNLTKERFDLYHAHVYLLDDEGKRLVLSAGAGETGQIMMEQKHTIPISLEHSLVARAARSGEGVIANNITREQSFLPNPLLPETRSEMAIPMIVGNRVIGVLDVQSRYVDYFSEQDLSVQLTLASQVAVAIENARSFQTLQKQQEMVNKRAREMEVVAQVGAEVARALDVQNLLWDVCDLTKERFELYHAHVYLLDRDRDRLTLAAGAGEVGRSMVERGHSIALNRRNSVVARAAMDQVGVISNDVTADSTFLPNPLLFDTRSELAVPIIVGTEVLGVLDIQSDEPNQFTDEDVKIQEVLADQIGVALENARLYEETLEQAQREREAADRLREVDRLKSQFLANMSHELRTPLNSIIGYSEVLLDGVDGELTEDAVEDIEAIYGSGKHLLSIINEILDLAKIEAGEMKLDRKEMSIIDLISEVVKSGQILLKNKPVVLEMVQEREIPMVYADVIRLRQIIWNLVSNAVKFTESGSVRVHINQTEDKMALVTVRDTGIGMTQEGLSVIFERFSQVDGSSTRRAGGTGLGLTITKQLIEMHGGTIEVDSELGVGSTFWFTVPLVISETEEEQV